MGELNGAGKETFTSPSRRSEHGPPKFFYPTTSLHSVITQKTTMWTRWMIPGFYISPKEKS